MIRVTTNSTLHMYQSNLMQSSNQLYSAMEKLMTGRNFDSYASNPAGATRAFKLHSALNAVNAQAANNETVLNKFGTAYSILDEVTNELTHDLAQAPALGGLDNSHLSSLNSYAQVIRSGADAIVQVLNGKYENDFIFNGSETGEAPFAIQEDQSQNPPMDVLTFRGWRVDVPNNDDVYLDLNGKEVLENGVPLTNSDVHDKLTDMAGETLYVDVGLGFQLDRNGAVIPSTAFDSALSGMDILGFGLDEDGDPKNIVSIMLRISDVFGGYQHNDAANTEGTWGPAGNYDDASRLVSKFEKAHNGLIQEHVELSSQADYLETNQTRLKSTFDSLNNELVAIEDIDRVDAILQLSYAQTCYNAALQVGANVIPQSLMDYLR